MLLANSSPVLYNGCNWLCWRATKEEAKEGRGLSVPMQGVNLDSLYCPLQ